MTAAAAATREVQVPDGARLAVTVLGDGPPLVMVPGSLQPGAALLPLAAQLTGRYTCWLVDRRGYGASTDAPDGTPYDVRTEYADVAAVTAAAGAGATVFGYSFGAVCALGAAAVAAPPQRLVLFEPPLPSGSPLVGPALHRYRELLDAGAVDEAVEYAGRAVVGLDDAQLAALRAGPAWPVMTASAHRWLRELAAVDALDVDALLAVPCPTTVVVTGAGPLRAGAERLVDALPDARLAELVGHGHDVVATDPGSLAALLTGPPAASSR